MRTIHFELARSTLGWLQLCISPARFIDSIFELVDIWTETTEEQEYLDMLDLLTRGITKVCNATRIWCAVSQTLDGCTGAPRGCFHTSGGI